MQDVECSANLVSPDALPGFLPSSPVASSRWSSTDKVTLQSYQHPPGTVAFPGLVSNSLVAYLGPEILIEERTDGLPRERRWAGRGQVSVVPAGQPLHRVLATRADVAVIHLSTDLIGSAIEDVFEQEARGAELVRRFVQADPCSEQIARLLMQEIGSVGAGTMLLTETLGLALAIHLVRRHSSLSPPLAEPAPVSMAGGQLRRVIDYMNAHLGEPVSLQQLAAVCPLSPSHFVRAFRAATGQPPHRYLIGLRMARARQLLEHTTLPIIEVGVRCGYDGPTHFTATFRKTTGLSPRAWRLARRS